MFPPCEAKETCLSVVSHRKLAEVIKLLDALTDFEIEIGEVIITLNVPEECPVGARLIDNVRIFSNLKRRGFADNHNFAYALSDKKHFLVMNSDIELSLNFKSLIESSNISELPEVWAPIVITALGVDQPVVPKTISLSFIGRFFPSLFPEINYYRGSEVIGTVNRGWFSGCCILFTNKSFMLVGGFDPAYIMYYEDVDLSIAAGQKKVALNVQTQASIVHAGRRGSRHELRLLVYHLSSASYFFVKSVGRWIWQSVRF